MILLVDDQPAMRLLAHHMLRMGGFDVLEAGGGAQALLIATGATSDGGRIDALVTDVVMPGMSGPALVNKLREHGIALPVVYMTGYGVDTARQQGVPDGATVLTKPFTVSTLLNAVREAISSVAGEAAVSSASEPATSLPC